MSTGCERCRAKDDLIEMLVGRLAARSSADPEAGVPLWRALAEEAEVPEEEGAEVPENLEALTSAFRSVHDGEPYEGCRIIRDGEERGIEES